MLLSKQNLLFTTEYNNIAFYPLSLFCTPLLSFSHCLFVSLSIYVTFQSTCFICDESIDWTPIEKGSAMEGIKNIPS